LLRIAHYPVDALKLHVRKLRKNEPAHVRDIANAISTLGFKVPLLIGKNDVVIDGGARLEGAKLLGLSSVPCIRVDHLDETEQRLLRLAVNRLGEKGVWDLGELEAEFKELIIADAPIEISGFGADEVAQLISAGDEDRPETVDLARSTGPAIARVGDLFRLGRHCLICGDATDPTVMRRLMGDDVARFVFTDGPCDIVIGGDVTDGEARRLVSASGPMTEAQFLGFHRNWIEAVLPYLAEGGLLGTFTEWRNLSIVQAAATALALMCLSIWRCGQRRMPAPAVSTDPDMSCCRFSRKEPPRTSTTCPAANEAAFAAICGAIRKPPCLDQARGRGVRILGPKNRPRCWKMR
jgi:hypothetical protein